MIPAAINRYKSVQVTTCSPGELLLLLYDGLFRFLGEAAVALRKNDLATAGERISRSHEILGELVCGLNPAIAPELCANLEGLYFFSMTRIVEANLQKDPARIDDVLRILSPLREAWTIAVRGGAAAGAAAAETPQAQTG